MDMTGSDGVFSVPAEHVPGMVWLVAAPTSVWVLLCAAQFLASRGNGPASRFMGRVGELSIAARAALFAAWIGAGVHVALVPTHWTEDRTRAMLFVLDAAAFLFAMGWTLALRPGWRAVNLVVLAGTVATYAIYLLKGWETLDLVGLLTTTIELSVALVLLDPLQPAVGPAPRRERWVAVAALPVALVSLLGTGVVAEASNGDATTQHHAPNDMSNMPGMTNMHGMAGMAHHRGGQGGGTGAHEVRLSLPTTSPAGPVTWPVAMGDMGAGMAMVNHDCSATPTAAQQRAAVALVDKTVAAAAPYRSLAAAKAAGYVPVTPTGLPVVHYINPAIYREGSTLDPSAIPSLVYVNTAHGAVLSAAMYLVPPAAASQRPPQPGGCLTQWHVHTNLCFRDGMVVGIDNGGSCPAGSVNRTTPPMMHVWLAPVSGGPLAVDPAAVDQILAAAQLPVPRTPNGTA
jgi:hypothetical protein